ncbi:hypothetical protein Q73_12825 [Bacillus coahuilensis m2-6]|uniref:flagellar protein n=1 Tax=Bacillus coahuilensis TaxID=408580 RepID=UPI0001850953|nr:flagellar protein [Bacillus coahuilensis]KUP05699.1 hypothetical protein Q73_12825 [Bacillus coahuilensis m2-6]
MTAIKECFRLTKELYELLKISISTEERDQKIERITELLAKREEILPRLQKPSSLKEGEMAKQIVAMNTFVDQKLKVLQGEIQRDRNNLKKKKTGAKKYTNPYENMQFDGMFYDKRK